MSALSLPTTAAQIPNIEMLRRELDYGHKLPRCEAFRDDTRAFRKKFFTNEGVLGADLRDWKSHKNSLTKMTIAYLEGKKNGQLFWPDDKESPNYNNYQYSKHGLR